MLVKAAKWCTTKKIMQNPAKFAQCFMRNRDTNLNVSCFTVYYFPKLTKIFGFVGWDSNIILLLM